MIIVTGGSGSSFPQVSFVPQPTTRRTTTTTRRTTTTTTPRPTQPPQISFNEIESNEIEGASLISTSTRLGGGFSSSRFSGKQQQFFSNQNSPSVSSSTGNRFNSNIRFSKPIQTAPTFTVTTTTRRPTTTVKVSTKKPFTFSPRIHTGSHSTRFNNEVQQQITDNRISPLASGSIQVSQTQKNQFSSNNNRFASSQGNNRVTTQGNYHSRGDAAASSSAGQRTDTKILRINDSPAYSLQDTNAIVLFCDFDYARCPVRSRGQKWDYTTYQTPGFGKGFSTVVESGGQSNLEIRTVMNPSSGDGTVCLYFRFVNLNFGKDGGPPSNSGPLKFTVTVNSVKEARKSVEISERSSSALDWLTAKVQFTDLHSMFLLVFQVPYNQSPDNVYLAVDDILLTKGRCHM